MLSDSRRDLQAAAHSCILRGLSRLDAAGVPGCDFCFGSTRARSGNRSLAPRCGAEELGLGAELAAPLSELAVSWNARLVAQALKDLGVQVLNLVSDALERVARIR